MNSLDSIWSEKEVTLHEPGELTATCRLSFDRGVFAVGYGAASDKDC